MIIHLIYVNILLIIFNILLYKSIAKRERKSLIGKPYLKDSFEEKDLTDLTVKIFSVPYEKIGY